MKLTLTDIERGWFKGPADDVIVLEGTTYGVYQVTWNGVTAGSVHLLAGKWLAYDWSGEPIVSAEKYWSDPAITAVLVCDRFAAAEGEL